MIWFSIISLSLRITLSKSGLYGLSEMVETLYTVYAKVLRLFYLVNESTGAQADKNWSIS